MPSKTLLKSIAISVLLASKAVAFPGVIHTRQSEIEEEYDYVVIGGGTGGLSVSARLAEFSPEDTVLVIEAGPVLQGDADFPIVVPGLFGAGFQYLWHGLTSAPIPGLNNRSFGVLVAKIAGGASAINAMVFSRGNPSDYDLWETLGAKGWGWTKFLPFMKRCEKFHPPSAQQAVDFDIQYETAAKGTNGPVHRSFPPWAYPQTKSWLQALKQIGLPDSPADTYGLGANWITSALDPANMTRSYAKTAYYDGIAAELPNYHLLTGHQVTRIVFEGTNATGVEYTTGPDAPRIVVSARKEVILSAGAILSPKLLQISGVGESTLLSQLGVPLVANLPGVGRNLHDHALLNFTYTLDLPHGADPDELQRNATYNQEMFELYLTQKTGPYTVVVGNTVGNVPLSFTSKKASILAAALASNPIANLPTDTPLTVKAGYIAQRAAILAAIAQGKVASHSQLAFIQGSPSISFVKPLSRGLVRAASADPFAFPIVDYRTLSDPYDLAVLVEALKFSREAMNTPAMQQYNPVEIWPGPSVQTDAQIEDAIRDRLLPSFAHPVGTCSMLKKELGGVVDTRLRVYGVQGLRVVDASIIPVVVGSSTMSTVYAIGEKAASMILEDNA